MRLAALGALALAVVAVHAPVAHAGEVGKLMDLIRKAPAGMDRDEWREKRRDAARRLGELGDRRAVPLLMEVVEKEQFDVIAEISIESLGKLGDQRAVPVLRRVSKDPSRDRFVRQAAQRSLKQIGAPAEAPDKDRGPAPDGPDPDPDPEGEVGGGLGLGTERPATPVGPEFPADTLAATERFTLAAGAAHLRYDTIRELASLDGNAAAEYERTLDRERSAFRYGGAASVLAGTADLPPEANTSNSVLLNLAATGELRTYLGGRPIYGMVQGAVATSFIFVRINRPGTGNNTSEKRVAAEAHVAVGGGHGRILDVGVELRLRRIEAVLRQARALGRPITPDLARRIYGAWWDLRGEKGAHRHLQATIAILRDAGVLLGEPDASLTYKLLQVLVDGQLDRRPRGLDLNVAVAESFLLRDDDLVGGRVREGRIETLLASARFGRQSEDGEHEIVGQGFARYRIFTDSDAGEPTPWAIGASGAWRNYFYNEHYDPLGALEFRGLAALSRSGVGTSPRTSRLAVGVGWLWSPNRASRLRLAGEVSLEAEEILVGVTLEAVYGLLDVGYIGK